MNQFKSYNTLETSNFYPFHFKTMTTPKKSTKICNTIINTHICKVEYKKYAKIANLYTEINFTLALTFNFIWVLNVWSKKSHLVTYKFYFFWRTKKIFLLNNINEYNIFKWDKLERQIILFLGEFNWVIILNYLF